jgi:hypothetical protein
MVDRPEVTWPFIKSVAFCYYSIQDSGFLEDLPNTRSFPFVPKRSMNPGDCKSKSMSVIEL